MEVFHLLLPWQKKSITCSSLDQVQQHGCILDIDLCFSKDSCECCLQEHCFRGLDWSQESVFSKEWTKAFLAPKGACNDYSRRSFCHRSFHSIECSVWRNWKLQSFTMLYLWVLHLFNQWEVDTISVARFSDAVSYGTQWDIQSGPRENLTDGSSSFNQ